jgi:hypothetical protein
MKRILFLLAALALVPALAGAAAIDRMPVDRVIVKVCDHTGQPVASASLLTMEGASSYMRQGLIRADSNGVVVVEVGRDAYVGLRISAPGFKPFRLELDPGVAERRGKVIHVRLVKTKGKIPVSI